MKTKLLVNRTRVRQEAIRFGAEWGISVTRFSESFFEDVDKETRRAIGVLVMSNQQNKSRKTMS